MWGSDKRFGGRAAWSLDASVEWYGMYVSTESCVV